MSDGSFGPEHVRVAKNLNNLALTHQGRGDLDGAIALFREALALQGRLVGETHFRYANVAINLAKALREDGQAAESESLFRSVLSWNRRPGCPGPAVTGRLPRAPQT